MVAEEGWIGISEVADQFRTATDLNCHQVNAVGFPGCQRALRFVSARQPGGAAPLRHAAYGAEVNNSRTIFGTRRSWAENHGD